MVKRRRSSAPSSSTLVPYDADARQLAVASPIAVVPRGWGVKRVLRPDGSHDKYYFEPGTRRKFRSRREVARYLSGEGYPVRSVGKLSQRNRLKDSSDRRFSFSGVEESRWRRMVVFDGKLLSQSNVDEIDYNVDAPAAPSILPDGWIVEEVTRRHSTWIDRVDYRRFLSGICHAVSPHNNYYYEPETGQKFRSLIAVERYLEENAPLSQALEKIRENKPLAKIFKVEHRRKSSSPRQKNIPDENNEASPFLGPPSKVKWVIGSSQGDVWNPLICDAQVPDSVKQQWTKRFMQIMNDDGCDFESS